MQNQSALDKLRAQYKAWNAQKNEQTLKVPVLRAAAGDLRVVYREPEWNATKQIEQRLIGEVDPDSEDLRPVLNGRAEMLAKACLDIQIHDHDGCKGSTDGKPCKDDTHWHEGLGADKGRMSFHGAAVELELLPVDSDPLFAVFAVLASDWEVDRHGQAVETWEPSLPAPQEVEAFVDLSGTTGSSTSSPEPA